MIKTWWRTFRTHDVKKDSMRHRQACFCLSINFLWQTKAYLLEKLKYEDVTEKYCILILRFWNVEISLHFNLAFSRCSTSIYHPFDGQTEFSRVDFLREIVFLRRCVSNFCRDFLKTVENKGIPILSAAEMFSINSSFWLYKVCVDIPMGSRFVEIFLRFTYACVHTICLSGCQDRVPINWIIFTTRYT